MTDVTLSTALSATLLLLLGRSLLNVTEVLSHAPDYRDFGMYSWTARRMQRGPTRHGTTAAILDVAFAGNNFIALCALQAALALALLASILLGQGRFNLALLLPLLIVECLFSFRNASFGHDGSDRMHLLVFVAVAVCYCVNTPTAKASGAFFLTFALTFSYLTAGLVKLLSPRWRNGEAMIIVLSSDNYGTPALGNWLRSHRQLSKVAGLGVIAFEISFPFLLWWGPKSTAAVLTSALLFHLGIAVLMGLNSFVWSFGATYPAAFWVGTRVHTLFAQSVHIRLGHH